MSEKIVRIQVVQMADDEWSSQEIGGIMDRIAKEILTGKNPPNIVTVQEHGGWFLQYAMIDGKIEIVGTANGSAFFTDRIKEYRESIFNAKFTYLPRIERPKRMTHETHETAYVLETTTPMGEIT